MVGQVSNLKDMPLQTSFGKVALPLRQVKSIEFREDKETVIIRFGNGDQLTGALDLTDWGELKLLTMIGDVKVPWRLMRACSFDAMPRKAAVSGVRAVSTWGTEVPEKAFDGKRDTDWNSGAYAPAWIEADLGAPQPLADILLVPCQDIAGRTTHEVWVSNEPIGDDRAKAKLAHTFHGETKNEQPLKFDFPSNLSARYVQIRTTQSPTWAAWWEVEVRVWDHAQPPVAPPNQRTDSKDKSADNE